MSSRSRKPLPSVETQTVEFLEFARGRNEVVARWLEFGGFYVYLRYNPDFRKESDVPLGELLIIASVTIPQRYRHRGWFWRYCELCRALVAGGIAVESVANQRLHASLNNSRNFQEVRQGFFLLTSPFPLEARDNE